MSALVVDVIMYILLLIGVGFGGIGIIGLLIFPDIRSRMFTGVRATLISCGVITLAGIIYALFAYSIRGGAQYITFMLHACLFLILIVILNCVAAQRILRKTPKLNLVSPPDTVVCGDSCDQPKSE
jgi:multicomponent Na+:H+ antiporter subunit G